MSLVEVFVTFYNHAHLSLQFAVTFMKDNTVPEILCWLEAPLPNTGHAAEPSCYCTAAPQFALAEEVCSAISQIQEPHGL